MAQTLLNTNFLPTVFSKVFYKTPVKSSSPDKDRIISLEEVSGHDTPTDCWIIVYDRVYDITDFLDEHPGGSEILLEYAGRDASCAFRGYPHSRFALKSLSKFIVGELPEHHKIFRNVDGYRLSDLPE